jgi:two-component system chemotaxis response regulator CheY
MTPTAAKAPAMPSDASVKDVIVADDDYIVRGILRSVLEGVGFAVIQVVDGLEAIDRAAHMRAGLIILDYRMPRMDGISACAAIRRLPDHADTPIVVLTAFDDETTREAARQAGVSAFLAKPFKPVDLLRAIADLLGTAPAAGGAAPESIPFIWERRQEPRPLFGEPVQLAEGRRVLNICRR